MWTDHDRRLAQVLIQAKAVPVEALHRMRALQASGEERRGLAELLLDHELIDTARLERFEHSSLVPHEAVTGDDTIILAGSPGASDSAKGRRIRTLGGFEVMCALASGANGTVYKARDPRTGDLIALKVLSPGCEGKGGAERFLREARVACALRHPGLVRGYGAGHENGLHWFAMELVEGESVGARLRREGALPLPEVVDIGRVICEALECARDHGIVHRDVKPDNILIDTRGRVKLCDLGLARPYMQKSSVTTSGVALGTPRYIAPEQARGSSEVDHRADLYALGITLFHLAAGRAPFDGTNGLDVLTKHIYEDVPKLSAIDPSLPPDLERVIHRATRKRANDRYQSAREMGRALDRVAVRLRAQADAGQPARRPPASAPERAPGI